MKTLKANKDEWGGSIRGEAALLQVPVEQFFEKTFVRERGEIVSRTELVKNRQRHAPRHPLARHVGEIPATAQKSFHNLDLRVSQAIQVRSERHRLERTAQRGIAHGTRKHLRKRRRFCFAFAHDNRS